MWDRLHAEDRGLALVPHDAESDTFSSEILHVGEHAGKPRRALYFNN